MGESKVLLNNIAKVLSGTFLAQIINIGATLIITRIYSTESYGTYSFFFSLTTFIAVLSTGGFEYLIAKQADHTRAISLFRISMYCIGLVSLVVLISVSIIDLFIELESFYYLLFIASSFSAIFIATNLLFTHFKNYGSLSANKVGQASFVSALQLGLQRFLSQSGLIIGLIAGRFINSVLFFLRSLQTIRKEGFSFSKGSTLDELKRSWKSAFVITYSTVFSRGALEAPIFLTTLFFDEYILGLYALSYRVLSLPVSLIATSIEQVLYKEVAEKVNSGLKVTGIILKNWTFLLLIAIPALLVLFFFGESLFSFVFGEEWKESGSIAIILGPMIVLNLLNSSTGRTLYIIHKESISFKFSVANLLLIIVAFLYGYYTNSFYNAIISMVVLRSTSLILYNLILIQAFRKNYKKAHES